MSKILLINGSPNEKGCTYTALAEIAATLHEQGVETEMIWLGKKPVAGLHCLPQLYEDRLLCLCGHRQ